MDWYQKKTLQTEQQEKIKLTCLPAAHWSRRLGQKRNTTLWAGYLLEYNGKKIYFAGDTAYGKPVFEHIAKRIAAPDMAILPIGAYRLAAWFMKGSQLRSPEEAVQIGLDLNSQKFI